VVWPGGSPLILVVLGSVVDHGGWWSWVLWWTMVAPLILLAWWFPLVDPGGPGCGLAWWFPFDPGGPGFGGSPLILVVLGSVVDHGGSPDPSGLVVPLG